MSTIRRQTSKRGGASLKPSHFGGCLICNGSVAGPSAELCRNCGERQAALYEDPRYPENNPEALWNGAHGDEDIYGQRLGPENWPPKDSIATFVRDRFLTQLTRTPIRGALLTLPLPAGIRLIGPFILRQLADEGLIDVWDGGDGYYFALKADRILH